MSLERPSRLRLDVADRDTFLPAINLGEVLRALLQKLLRRWVLLASVVATCVALAVVYSLLATPVYTANGSILIDPRIGGNPGDSSDMIPGLLMSDALTVDSELRVLASREVTASAVRVLGLTNPEASPSLVRRIAGWVGLGAGPESTAGLSEQALEERRTEALRHDFVQGLTVERAGESFVLDISYTSTQVEFTAQAVNTLMREYLRLSGEQQIARAEQTRLWLSGRIEDLENEVEAAETAVAEYRRANQLLAPQGALLPTEVALNAAIAELVRLRSLAVSVEVQIRRLTEQVATGNLDAIQIPLEERTSALDDFEARYTELLQQERELLLSWDETAPLVVSHRRLMAETRDLMIGEFRQILDRLKVRGETMNQQVTATEQVIAELQNQYADDTTKTVRLRSLEREAEAKRVLYEQLLEQFNSTSQLLTFEATSGRVIAWAVVPDRKSAPQSKQIVVLAAFAGFVLAVSAIFLLESLDSSFRAQKDVSDSLRAPFLGLVPSFQSEEGPPDAKGRAVRSARWQSLSKIAQRYDFSATFPTSVSAETMRSIHVHLTMHKTAASQGGIAAGVVSSVRGEGKTTTAFNIATYLARQNESVVLVDLDLISRELTRQIEEMLPDSNSLALFLQDPGAAMNNLKAIAEFSGLAVIGNPDQGKPLPSATRDADQLKELLLHLRRQFDFVILDLPPLQGAADTQLLARLSDVLVFVIRWGSTPKQQVLSAVRKSGLREDQFLGTVLTQAKLPEYRSYNRDEVTDYYS